MNKENKKRDGNIHGGEKVREKELISSKLVSVELPPQEG